jgi:hypothetical protein
MKVLDLQCANHHVFEGWFGSENDFVRQCERSLVQCPLCGDAIITKMLSAPRLNLAVNHLQSAEPLELVAPVPDAHALTSALLAIAKQVIAQTTDVGLQFAEEARKIHYGETEVRGIRGRTTPEEARDLIEEGIEILPFALPQALKETLQ